MKYCSICGKEIMDEAVVCPACGRPQADSINKSKEGASSIGWGALGFCVPAAGLILYLMWKDGTPLKAKSAGTGALIGFIAIVIAWFFYFVHTVAVMGIY